MTVKTMRNSQESMLHDETKTLSRISKWRT